MINMYENGLFSLRWFSLAIHLKWLCAAFKHYITLSVYISGAIYTFNLATIYIIYLYFLTNKYIIHTQMNISTFMPIRVWFDVQVAWL